eukprot:COSAG05_NODE_8198_length_727_cov_0.961783_1_plen_43_part_00
MKLDMALYVEVQALRQALIEREAQIKRGDDNVATVDHLGFPQ